MVPSVPTPSREGIPNVPVDLADDELQLLAEIATGVTTDVAARRLELSARTLRRRLRAICDQLGVNTPIEAVVWAARRQLI
ncbi:LuxR family transcriptional regulator [Allosalinactinospora lopnorensis]|uniref:LuxR family transcriptional regulator n=1 Tax=Allosalinactinospora lopnorensis TaxID=1352348 RepID=UPI001F2908B0|nr:LuxR family transcriptional regulator [Allosalinactinospora lopnorensis]